MENALTGMQTLLEGKDQYQNGCSLIPHKETENGTSKEAKTGRQVDKSKEARKVATGLNTVSPATPVGCHRVNPEDVVNAGEKMKLSLV